MDDRGIFMTCLFIALLAAVSCAEEPPHAEIFSLGGQAQILAAPSAEWVEAEEGAQLRSGDGIRTGSGAYVELAFDGDSIVRVGPDSYVVVLLKDGEKIELVNGEIYCAVKNLPKGSSFEVRTPLGISGARGTDWFTKVDGGAMDVESYDGSPFVRNVEPDGALSKDETVVRSGFGTRIAGFRGPFAPVRLSEARMERWRAWKAGVKERRAAAIQRRRDRNEQRQKRRGSWKKKKPQT